MGIVMGSAFLLGRTPLHDYAAMGVLIAGGALIMLICCIITRRLYATRDF
jgi:hypothetical protein